MRDECQTINLAGINPDRLISALDEKQEKPPNITVKRLLSI